MPPLSSAHPLKPCLPQALDGGLARPGKGQALLCVSHLLSLSASAVLELQVAEMFIAMSPYSTNWKLPEIKN